MHTLGHGVFSSLHLLHESCIIEYIDISPLSTGMAKQVFGNMETFDPERGSDWPI